MRGRADTAVCCCRNLSVRPVAHDETYAIRQIRQRPPYWYVKPPNHACHDIHDTTIRRHSAVQRPIRLNRACHDIHDEQNTPDAPDTPDNPQRPSPTPTHRPRPQQERPAAGIQPTTGFRHINALLPRGRNITEFAVQQLSAQRFSGRCRRTPQPPPGRRQDRTPYAVRAPRHQADQAGPAPQYESRTWKSSTR